MSDSEFMVNEAPIYARVQKKRGPNLAMLAIPAAVLATGAIVFATSQPRTEAPAVAEQKGPQLSSAATAPVTTAPVIRAPAGVAPAAGPITTATPAPRTRTAAATQARRTVTSAPANDANSAAVEASAIVAPPLTPAPAPVTVAEPAPVVAAPSPVTATPPAPQPESAPEATPAPAAPTEPVQ